MNVSLTPALEKLIHKKVKSGVYNNASEVVREALRLLEEQDKRKNMLVSWDDHLDKKNGKTGTPKRDKYEEEFETFKIGVLIREARKSQNLTQEELA